MKFCFFGNISGALKGQTRGGGELQVCLFARALALEGHEVVIIDPTASESFITTEGVKLVNIPDWDKGLRGIRMFLYRIPALWKIFVRENADCYYVRMSDFLHILPYFAARKNGAKFIHAIASDFELLSFKEKFKYQFRNNFNLFRFLTLNLPNDLVNNYLLKKSDYVIIQHSGQKLHPGSVRGKIVIFPNIIDYSNLMSVKDPSRSYFVHVGDLTLLKGADNLYQLIKSIKKNHAIMIIGEPCDNKSKKIFGQINKMENVIVKGRLNHCETLRLIANARALINTSDCEGFPNIFLEAWAAGVPVISLKVNPGNVFNKYNLGVCCEGDLKRMKACIESDETANIDKGQLISYVSEFHDFSSAGERFLNAIEVFNKNLSQVEYVKPHNQS